MTQRLIVAGAMFSMVLTASLVAMVGWMIHQQQQTNAALLERMANLVPRSSDPLPQRDSHWNNLKIKVTNGGKDGPAAEGFDVLIEKRPGIGEVAQKNSSKHIAKIDKSGLADCGYVEPGIYQVTVGATWSEQTEVTFTVHPGTDHIEQIVAPERLPDLTSARFNVEGMPDSLSTYREAILIQFEQIGSRVVADRTWRKVPGSGMVGDSMPYILLVPKHGVWVAEATKEIVGTRSGVSINDGPLMWYSEFGDIARNAKWRKLDPTEKFTLPTGRYAVEFGLVHLDGYESNDSARRHDRRKLQARNNSPSDDNNESPSGVDPDSTIAESPTDLNPTDAMWGTHVESGLSEPLRTGLPLVVVAELGSVNEWTIALPKKIIEKIANSLIKPSVESYVPSSESYQPTPVRDEPVRQRKRPIPVEDAPEQGS